MKEKLNVGWVHLKHLNEYARFHKLTERAVKILLVLSINLRSRSFSRHDTSTTK